MLSSITHRLFLFRRAVSLITKFGDAGKSPSGDAASRNFGIYDSAASELNKMIFLRDF